MTRARRMSVALIVAMALIGAGVGAAATATPPSAQQKAVALTTVPSPTASAQNANDARSIAEERSSQLPLPAGGNFNGVRWEDLGGALSASELEGVLEYNAACQWLRALRDARQPQVAQDVLAAVPNWPALRSTDSGAVLKLAISQLESGGGTTGAGVLADCDASHARETEYATSLALVSST